MALKQIGNQVENIFVTLVAILWKAYCIYTGCHTVYIMIGILYIQGCHTVYIMIGILYTVYSRVAILYIMKGILYIHGLPYCIYYERHTVYTMVGILCPVQPPNTDRDWMLTAWITRLDIAGFSTSFSCLAWW